MSTNKFGGNVAIPPWEQEKKDKETAKDKQLAEFLKKAQEDMFNVKKALKKKPLKESLEESIELNESRLGRLRQAKEELDGLEVKEGEAAYHKDHGYVLVREFFIGDSTDVVGVRKEFDGKVMVRIVTLDGRLDCPSKELVPITEATRVLFGKK